MRAKERVEIVMIYPSLLGTYGDGGNAVVLMKRLAWRGYDPTVSIIEPGDRVPDSGDVYLLGGGEDSAQVTAARALKTDGRLQCAAERGAAVLAICAGFQIAGNTFVSGGRVIEGLGLLDVDTVRGSSRAVGEVVAVWGRPDGRTGWLTGFENHGGRTRIGAGSDPLAQIRLGRGNDEDFAEGATSGTTVGTYLHGPVLSRNPDLADHVLELGLGEKLTPLPDPAVDELRRQRLHSAGRLHKNSRNLTRDERKCG